MDTANIKNFYISNTLLYNITCPARCDNKNNNKNQLNACAAASSQAESKN